MEKIKEALELIKDEEEGGCELFGRYLTQVRELIEQGIAELEQKPRISGVKQVSIGGNCVQSVIITGDNKGVK